MFKKLESVISRFEEINNKLNDPDIFANRDEVKKLSKEFIECFMI